MSEWMGMLITYLEPSDSITVLIKCMLKPIPLGYAPFVIYLVRSVLLCHIYVAIIAFAASGHIVIA